MHLLGRAIRGKVNAISPLVFDPQAKIPTFLLHFDGQDVSEKVLIQTPRSATPHPPATLDHTPRPVGLIVERRESVSAEKLLDRFRCPQGRRHR